MFIERNIKIQNGFTGNLFINRKKCFIDNVVENDIVDIEIYKETSKYYLAKVINFVKKSNFRIKNKCKHCNCGGCELRYIEDDFYYKCKQNILYTNIIKNYPYFEKNDIQLFKVGENKRRRTTLNYKNGIFGFFKKNSNNIVKIDNCLNVTKNINKIIKNINGIELPNLYSVDITEVDNGVMLNFNFSNNFNINKLKKLDSIKNDVILITYCINTSNPIRYFVKEDPIIKLGNRNIIIPDKCFLQATKESQDFMIKIVCDNLKNCKKIADLYCGIGTYSFPLSLNAKVYSFEGDELMINSIKNNSFRSSINACKRDLFNQPLTNKELNDFDGIVINPPRNGAENQCKFIAKSNIKKIIYVSCNLDTFIRDTKLFIDKYKLTSLYLIDQFYMSKHFEVIGVFELL